MLLLLFGVSIFARLWAWLRAEAWAIAVMVSYADDPWIVLYIIGLDRCKWSLFSSSFLQTVSRFLRAQLPSVIVFLFLFVIRSAIGHDRGLFLHIFCWIAVDSLALLILFETSSSTWLIFMIAVWLIIVAVV